MAGTADLGFSLSQGTTSLSFTWSGFNDSLDQHVSDTISNLLSMPPSESIFDLQKEELLDELANGYLEKSYIQAISKFQTLISDKGLESNLIHEAMRGYTFTQFESDLSSWLKKGRFVWYISGNISPETAIKIAEDGIS